MDNDLSLDVFIVITKGSNIKYKYDKKREALVCNRILHTTFNYEFNYGFIPETLSPNGDTLDVVVIMDDELIPGSYINCIFLGYIETEDDHRVDTKILMCPSNKITPAYNEVLDIWDISAHTIDKIKYFFQHYKDLENKQLKIGEVYGKSEAIAVYLNSAINYEVNSNSVKNKINS